MGIFGISRPNSTAMSRLVLLVALVIFVIVALVNAGSIKSGPPPSFECTEDGFFADYHRGCQVYYHCDAGVKITYGCPEGFLFNEEVKACLKAETVSCPYPA